jgi:FkbM family methyltransferase
VRNYAISVIAKILEMRTKVVTGKNIDSWRVKETQDLAYYAERALLICEFVASNSASFDLTGELFYDEESRELMRLLYAYRALGPSRVILPANTPEYFQGYDKARKLRVSPSERSFAPFEMSIFSIPFRGEKIDVECWLGSAVFSFFLEQYFFERGGVRIAPEAGDVVIDAGGCFGDTSLAFAAAVGEGGCVISFEPIPAQRVVFRANMERNPVLSKRVFLFDKAASDLSKQSILLSNAGASSRPDSDGSVLAETITIDDYCSDQGLDRLNYIKADVEGSEIKLLMGARNSIQCFKPKLAISAYHEVDHLLRIPQLIREIDPSYRMFLGHHSIHTEESIVYAYPASP